MIKTHLKPISNQNPSNPLPYECRSRADPSSTHGSFVGLRSVQTDHHAEIEISANPSPFPTINHHATTKSIEERESYGEQRIEGRA
jgi:hypothetical protein